MQPLLDFLPVLAFFITAKLVDIYAATIVLIVAVVLQTAYQWFRHRKVSTMALISGALVLVFGGLTLWIHDEAFIKWKVTVVFWLFSLGFLASHYTGGAPIIERMLGETMKLDRAIWLRASWLWIVFYGALGGVNLYIARNFSTDAWLNFKLYGTVGLNLVFFFALVLWLSSKLPPEQADSTGSGSTDSSGHVS